MRISKQIQEFIEKQKAKTFEKELDKIEDIYTFLNYEKWNELNNIEKRIIIQKLVDKEVEKLGIQNPPELVISEESLGMYVVGGYKKETNTLYIASNILDDVFLIYNTIVHELTHCKQWKNIDNGTGNELYKICMSEDVTKINFCDFKDVNGILHININLFNEEFSTMLYKLSLPEREAYQRAYEAELKYNPYAKDELREAYTIFYKKMKLNYTREEINRIIDDSFLYLFYTKMPVGTYENRNIHASIMYNITCSAILNMENSIENQNLLNIDYERNMLAKYGYTRTGYPPINDLKSDAAKYVDNIHNLSEMSVENQIANPELFAMLFLHKKQNIFPYIKDKEAFLYELVHSDWDDNMQNEILDYYNEEEGETDYEYE